MEFEPGQEIGTLEIERELGRGAFGVVYLARDTLLARRVALKVLPGGGDAVPAEVREQALTEARLTATLMSPHIVTLYRIRESEDGGFWQEMEFVDGGSLEDRLEEGKALSVAEAVGIFRGLLRALRTAHAARVIHGDIKPANLLFDSEGRVKLADFGVARLIEGTGREIELHGEIFGSPLYMAPEVITGRSTGMAADLWSAGVIAYLLLSGRLPFPATTFPELLEKLRRAEPDPLPDEVPDPLSALVLRCLSGEVADRPDSAGEVLDELDRLAEADIRFGETAPVERPTNWVPLATSFVGREREVEEISRLFVEEEKSLVTLTGPGGIGKTRISQELCGALLDAFPGGSWFVALDEVFDLDGIGQEVAEALRLPPAPGEDPIERIADVLRFRKPLLLVLDNFEQLVEHAAKTVGAWREAAPQVRFLVTSRALLGLGDELRYELQALPTPAVAEGAPVTAEKAGAFPGVRLFVDRARDAEPSFELSEENAGEVVAIARELSGIPLAIELAAARARIMRPGQIAKNLGRKFQLLKSTRLDVTVRQRTLAGAIEWSYDLLSDWEKDAFLQACYFRDGLSLTAADEVIDVSAHEGAPPALEIARGLRDKSLFTAYDAANEPRLGMYRAIREYGAEQWKKTAGEDRMTALAERHAGYFLSFADEWNARIHGRRSQEALDRIGVETGNLGVVRDWALASADADLAARAALAAAETIRVRGAPKQLLSWVGAALDALGEAMTGSRSRLTVYLAAGQRMAGEWDAALPTATAAVDVARGLSDPAALVDAVLEQGEMLRNRGELERALAAFSEGEELARTLGKKRALAVGMGGRGMVMGQRRDLDAAFTCFCEAESLARSAGDHQTRAFYTHQRGVVYESRAELEAAIQCYTEAEDLSRRLGDRLRVSVSLGARANALVQSGRPEEARACYLEAEEIARELGARQRIGQIVGARGGMHAFLEEHDDALACFEVAEAIARELGDRRRLVVSLTQRARVLEVRERTEEAFALYREAEEICEEVGDRFVWARTLCMRGSLHERSGQVDEAWDALSRGIAMFDDLKANQSVWYFAAKADLARVAHARGDRETLARLGREGMELAEKLGITLQYPEKAVRDALVVFMSIAGPVGGAS